MQFFKRNLLVLGVLISTICSAQPYVLNEQVTKFFSEDFSDKSDAFPESPSSDPKFWGAYGDGYYFMMRKIAAPRVVIANSKEVLSSNFYIKSKIQLGPVKSEDASVGILFLAQPGGKGGFILEINRRRSFRIQEIGSGAFITKEGEQGWIKHRMIQPSQRNNTVEIKAFRGKFDVYINDAYVYSFVNTTYKGGKFGLYCGPDSESRVIYFNAYHLDVPGAEPELVPKNLQAIIDSLTLANDSLRTLALSAQYGEEKDAINAIKILEEQIGIVRTENSQLKTLLSEYESQDPAVNTAQESLNTEEFTGKINALTHERDSLNAEVEKLQAQVQFMNETVKEIKHEFTVFKTKNTGDQVQENSIESFSIKNTQATDTIAEATPKSEPTIKKDETNYANTLNLDSTNVVQTSEVNQGLNLAADTISPENTNQPIYENLKTTEATSIEEEVIDEIDSSDEEEENEDNTQLVPLSEQKIPVQKAIKQPYTKH